MIPLRRLTLWMAPLLLLIPGCGGEATGGADRTLVVTTTGILGDVVSNLAGDAVEVEVLIPPGVDPHDFQPSARQAALLREADLVVANGLGLEEGLEDAIAAAGEEGVEVLEVAPAVDPIPFGEHGDEDHQAEDREHGSSDPHFWHDPMRMARAVELIAERLSSLDTPTAPEEWRERAAAYASELREVDAQIEQILSTVPPERRKLVTNHDAFGYFADRYGFEIVGVVVPGGSTLAEPSARELAELVATLEREEVDVIFTENVQASSLAETVAAELGEEVEVVELVSDSLGVAGSGAQTYAQMLLENARRVAAALS